ncbi:MAG: hypothetical protein ACI8ZF_000467 [Candidatus Midichloriaceae bacterium]|jgi:hypothetical protein
MGYGEAYYNFITNEMCQPSDWEYDLLNISIPLTSQKVYSLISSSDQYINDDNMCNQLSITMAHMFLTSGSY